MTLLPFKRYARSDWTELPLIRLSQEARPPLGALRQSPIFLIVPCIMAVFGFVLFKRMVWVLVDEVKLVPGSRNTRRPAVGTTLAGGPLEKVAGKRAVTASNYCL